MKRTGTTTVTLPSTRAVVAFDPPVETPAERRRKTPPRLHANTFRSTLKWMLSSIPKGEQVFVDMLRLMPPEVADPRVVKLIAAYDRTTPKPGLDQLCQTYRIRPSEAYGWFAQSCFDQCAEMLRVQAWMATPEIMQASIARAKDIANGTDERRLIFTALGFLPTSKGIRIQNNLIGAGESRDPVNTHTFESTQRHAASIVRALRAATPVTGTRVPNDTP